MAEPTLRRELTLRDLTLFSIAGIIGTRWLAASAHAGSSSLLLWLLAIFLFFVPSAFAVARLSVKYPQEGGLYVWTRESFGEWPAFLSAILYFMQTVFWFPSAAIAYTSVAVYMLGDSWIPLADNRYYVLTASLAVVWLSLGANLVGVDIGKWTENLGGLATYLIGSVLVALAVVLWMKRGPAAPITLTSKFDWQTVNFWSQIAYALTGLELAPIMGGEIRNPTRDLPRAAWISSGFCGAFYFLGTAAMLVVLAPATINPIHGLAQAAHQAGRELGLAWLAPVLALLIVIGAIGQLGAVGTATARLPLVLGVDAYLPPAFAKLHPRWRTPYISILVLGALCSVFLILLQVGETLRAAYQLLVDLTIISAFIPYAYIFLSAWKAGSRWSAFFGTAVTLIALACSVIPTADVSSVANFEMKVFGGTALMIAFAWVLYVRGRRRALAAAA